MQSDEIINVSSDTRGNSVTGCEVAEKENLPRQRVRQKFNPMMRSLVWNWSVKNESNDKQKYEQCAQPAQVLPAADKQRPQEEPQYQQLCYR